MDPIWDGKVALKVSSRLKQCFRVRQRECIYCRGTAGSFNKGEHVIPQAFGTFGSGTWVLHDIVCDDCNQFFGDNLEVYFNRSSPEALERFEHGKPRNEATDIHRDRVSTVSTSPQSKGIKFAPITHELLPQVGFRLANQTEAREFFSIEQLEAMSSLDKTKYDLKSRDGIKLMANDEGSLDRLISLLAKLGIAFNRQSEAPPLGKHQVTLENIIRIDEVNLRTIAKIAFNYMAQVRGSAYCLRSDFDSIRSFIRYGTRPPFAPATPSNTPILAYDTETKRQTLGHIIVLEKRDNGSTIQSRVSLFNGITYTVTLAKFFSGSFSSPDIGHHFDFQQKKIDSLSTGGKDYRVI